MADEAVIVRGDGPIPCSILICGEAPGRHEDRYGLPFVGRSGQLLFQLLQRYAGITREQCYVTNLVKERPAGSDPALDDIPPTPEMIEKWSMLLLAEILKVQPRFILAVGAHATRFLLQSEESMEVLHGRHLALSAAFGEEFCASLNVCPSIIPCWHPAAGLRDDDEIALTAYDCEAFGQAVRGELPWEGAQSRLSYPGNYTVLRGRWLTSLPRVEEPQDGVIGCDTEGSIEAPYSLQFSPRPGLGYFIYADDHAAVADFLRYLDIYRPSVCFHYAQHDLKALRNFSPPIDLVRMGLRIEDTFFLQYHLQLEPGGLKALAIRHCGMEMQEYKEAVQPYVDRARRALLREAGAQLEALFTYRDVFSAKTGKKLKKQEYVLLDDLRPQPLFPAELREGVVALEGKLRRARKDEEKGKAVVWANRFKSLNGWEQQAALKLAAVPRWPDLSGGLQLMPEADVVAYAAKDPDATLRVRSRLLPMCDARGLQAVRALDYGVLPMIDRMESTGLLLNPDALRELEIESEAKVTLYTEMFREFLGDPEFNPNSGDDMAEVLYEKLGLPIMKMTKGGERGRVDKKSLQALKEKHVMVTWVMDFKEVWGNLTKFIRPIWRYRKPDNRLHPSIKAAFVATGRFSTENPNLMAFPARTEMGKKVRSCFIAPPGRVLHSIDLSQIELRVTAALSGDEAMLEIFRTGQDMHKATARRMFKTGEPTGDQRYGAKTVNFGILYGLTAAGLYMQYVLKGIATTLEECEETIAAWFRAYPRVKPWMQEVLTQARLEGAARTPAGRMRFMPALRLTGEGWPWEYLRSGAERATNNHPVQGGAGECMKRGMIRVWEHVYPELWKRGAYCEPLLQIHDELLTEVDDDEEVRMQWDLGALWALQNDELAAKVPVKAESKYGANWGLLK